MYISVLLTGLVFAAASCKHLAIGTNTASVREVHDTLREHTRDSVWVYVRGDTLREYHVREIEREKVVMVADSASVSETLKGDPYVPKWVWWLAGVAGVIVSVFIFWVAIKIGSMMRG